MLDVTIMEVENVINSLKNASPVPDEFPAFVHMSDGQYY